MGVAMGLAFALFLVLVNPSEIATIVEHGGTHALTELVGTLMLAFGIGATVTGVVFVIMEDD
jgi:small neutral amino acid transporter SnatA (MarC family)